MTRRQDPTRPSGPAGVHPAGRTHPAPPRRATLTGRTAILLAVLGALVVTLAIPVREWFAQRSEIAGLTQDVAAAEQRVAELERQRARWDDPAYVEAQARQRLRYVRPGEVGYVVVDDQAGDPVADRDPSGRLDEQPWYSRLWDSVEHADRGSAGPDGSAASSGGGPAGGATGSPGGG